MIRDLGDISLPQESTALVDLGSMVDIYFRLSSFESFESETSHGEKYPK
jgi:hypothetical protein